MGDPTSTEHTGTESDAASSGTEHGGTSSESTSDSSHTESSSTEGASTEGAHTEGEHTDGAHTEGGATEGEHTEGAHTEGEHTEGGHTEGEHGDGAHAGGEHEGGEHEGGEHEGGEHGGESPEFDSQGGKVFGGVADGLDGIAELVHDDKAEEALHTAAEVSRRILARDPMHEESWRRLMVCHAQAGERAQAIRVYHQLADLLRREFESEPDPATTALFRSIQAGKRVQNA